MAPTVQSLEAEMQRCVAKMQFEEAARLRDRLKVLKAQQAGVGEKVEALEAQLQKHVAAQEFEAAAKLRDEIKVLRRGPASDGNEASEKRDGNKRTVCIQHLPPATKKGALARHFPTAGRISIIEGDTEAHAFINFHTAAEAEAAAAPGTFDFDGKAVTIFWRGSKQAIQRDGAEQSRMVFVGNLPPTSETELQDCFPTAKTIKVHQGKKHQFAFILFDTAEEAQRVSQTKVEVAGHLVSPHMAGDKEAVRSTMKEEDDRTVYLCSLPQKTTKDELQKLFPTAERISLHQGKEKNPCSFVIFRTVEEAQRVSQTKVELAGCKIVPRMANNRKNLENRKEERQEELRRTVHARRLPPTTSHAELEQLFPSAEAIMLHQETKHAYAFVIFNTAEEAQRIAQGKLELAGHPIALQMAVDKGERDDRSVFITGLPLTITEAELKQRFPIAQDVVVFQKQTYAFAFVCLPTVEDAVAMASQAEVEVAGRTVGLKMKDAEFRKRSPHGDVPDAKRQKH
eukprot:GGOE01055544.1.p1 GENE.GGOE01055544.1~~GGOE01055544.1.p1  ORF type:complete len:512 (-),score=123.64 GGOE01055544.1:562-2097(-)